MNHLPRVRNRARFGPYIGRIRNPEYCSLFRFRRDAMYKAGGARVAFPIASCHLDPKQKAMPSSDTWVRQVPLFHQSIVHASLSGPFCTKSCRRISKRCWQRPNSIPRTALGIPNSSRGNSSVILVAVSIHGVSLGSNVSHVAMKDFSH